MGSVEADESALEENGMNPPIERTNSENTPDSPTVPELEIPGPVQDIIYRIEQAQASRVREDTKTQMIDIMSNVHQIITRYSVDFDLSLGRSSFLTERMKKQRTVFLERMATYTKNVESREKTLAYILAWLEEWSKFPEMFQRKTTKSVNLQRDCEGLVRLKKKTLKRLFRK